jgi:cyclohexanecarboxylate-CoA ligase
MPLAPTYLPPHAVRWRREGRWGTDTVWTAYARTAAARPAATAVVDGDLRLDFASVVGRASAIAGRLRSLGVGPGDAVAFQLPNWWETVAAYLALARLGAVAVPILPTARERELRFVLAESGATVLLVPGELRGTDHRTLAAVAGRERPGLAIVVVRAEPGPGMHGLEALPDADLGPPATDADAIALLMYTSGTTTAPKGVLHSHATLLAKARALGPVHALAANDVVLMPSPLTHVSGLLYAVLVPAVHGTGTVLMARWDADAALALLAREGVTYMIGAPTFLRDLADHPDADRTILDRFRLFSCGGAVVDPALVRRAGDRLGCVAKRVYGSTEFPTLSTSGPDDPPDARIDTEGRPFGGAEIRIVTDAGHAAAHGEEGEVQARGPECFLGYRDPALNAAAFTGDGWFRTGDLGLLDRDGRLRITGRLKEVIIRKGENVSAREVEDLVATHPAVAETAVIGLPDATAGEIVCAVLRPRPGHAPPTIEGLAAHLLAAGLSKRKLPERVEVVEDFPRTESGKILKRELQRRYAPA